MQGHRMHDGEQSASGGGHEGHGGGKSSGGGHDRHAGHTTHMFRDRFWVSLALSIPVIL